MKKRANFLFIEKSGEVFTLSMTPELQDDIGTVGYVEYIAGKTLQVEDPILNLEASKTVLELASPVAGTVVERNEAVLNEPALLNSAKPEENWVVKLTDVDEAIFAELENA